MTAYLAATKAGNPFVEVDCQTLSNGAVISMHDATLDRTTNYRGSVQDYPTADWEKVRVDASRLLGPGWAQYPVPYIDEILTTFGNRKIVFLESKDYASRLSIIQKLKEYHISPDWTVVNSVAADRLTPAIAAGYKTCKHIDPGEEPSPASLKHKGFWAVSCHVSTKEAYIRALKAAGLKVIIYTVNRQSERDRLLGYGIDGFYTDDPLYLEMSGKYRLTTDPFRSQRWAPGMLEAQPGGRGRFFAPDKWGLDAAATNTYKGCLQGWLSPIGGKTKALSWSMELSITFGQSMDERRWASVAVMTTDKPLNSDTAPAEILSGYNFLFRKSGELTVYRYDGTPKQEPVLAKEVRGPAINSGDTVRFRITVTPDTLLMERVDGQARLSLADDRYRGGYVTFGAKGLGALFSSVQLNTP